MKRRRYEVSGIIQITVFATSGPEAARLAEERAERLSKGRVIVDLDNISRDGLAACPIGDAEYLDDEEEVA